MIDFRSILDAWLCRTRPDDPRLWHKWVVAFPVRLRAGGVSTGMGQLWRRKGERGWEYQEDEPTMEELQADAW